MGGFIMRKILVVIDMQKDFVDGVLGTKEAQGIVTNVIDRIKSYNKEDIVATKDTHKADYLQTQEGQNLPVEHCIEGTDGWEFDKAIEEALGDVLVFCKSAFGSEELVDYLFELNQKEALEIELVGLCTDICVVLNALSLKSKMPEVKISVRMSCCAGTTPKSHEAALLTMKVCQIEVK